jgi:hypothetical protein
MRRERWAGTVNGLPLFLSGDTLTETQALTLTHTDRRFSGQRQIACKESSGPVDCVVDDEDTVNEYGYDEKVDEDRDNGKDSVAHTLFCTCPAGNLITSQELLRALILPAGRREC